MKMGNLIHIRPETDDQIYADAEALVDHSRTTGALEFLIVSLVFAAAGILPPLLLSRFLYS